MKLYSKKEARHMLCRYHNLDGAEALFGKEGAEKIMQRIHSIQYDPLNVAARNADLVLQARVRDYKESDLYNLLYKEHKLVDGFDKEMCIYESEDFARFSFVRNEYQKHVIPTLEHRNQMEIFEILDDVKDFVKEHGLTGTKDISIGEVRESRWGPKKLSSAALDYLFNKGELCVADKKGTQKYFDLTERVLDGKSLQCDENMTIEDFLEWYTERRIQSVGFLWNKSGGGWQGRFLNENETRSSILQTLLEKNRIDEIQVEGIEESFYISNNFEEYMKYQTSNSYVRFIARFEAEPVREACEFVLKNWWWEPEIEPTDDMKESILKEMARFAEFLQVNTGYILTAYNILSGFFLYFTGNSILNRLPIYHIARYDCPFSF